MMPETDSRIHPPPRWMNDWTARFAGGDAAVLLSEWNPLQCRFRIACLRTSRRSARDIMRRPASRGRWGTNQSAFCWPRM